MKTYNELMLETPKQAVEVTFGDNNRLGQGVLRKMVDSLFNNASDPSPKFGIASTFLNLKKAGYSKVQSNAIRKAVIKGMQSAIKKANISSLYTIDNESKTFERYKFYDIDQSEGLDILLHDRIRAYDIARKEIEKEITKLNIGV